MATRTIIPRFLLPLQGSIWRGVQIPLSQNILVRFASTSGSGGKDGGDKPIVLEKPERFNPPSHGSRLKKNAMPRHYAPELTREEKVVQSTKHYPGIMAPEGTWSHFFWHNRMLHTVITLGTLLSLAIFTFFMNYAQNSPFKDLLPPISDLWRRPIHFVDTWSSVIAMHERDKSLRAYEKRIEHQNDAAKRRYYMKMHGIETKDPITVVFGKGEDPKTDVEIEAEALGYEVPEDQRTPVPRRKWFGIF